MMKKAKIICTAVLIWLPKIPGVYPNSICPLLVLVDAALNKEQYVLAGLYISQAFNSLIHDSILYAAHSRGVSAAITSPEDDMYEKLLVQIQMSDSPDALILLPVYNGTRQGSTVSPDPSINVVIELQSQALPAFQAASVDVSLICYADGTIVPSCTCSRQKDNFITLRAQYVKIRLGFKASKSEVVVFKWNERSDICVTYKMLHIQDFCTPQSCFNFKVLFTY
ncbi:hypothetical protein QYM36_007637 [Artemia franciscana]|uniref:Reverse transcriptase domain-containing protein n=1 Tax=Artemia franciscana TaxID=6661 RepID=A0AA88IN69_ARTSF|nr:hypothetical protein QYM36_007637 [Artemia franciscana]